MFPNKVFHQCSTSHRDLTCLSQEKKIDILFLKRRLYDWYLKLKLFSIYVNYFFRWAFLFTCFSNIQFLHLTQMMT